MTKFKTVSNLKSVSLLNHINFKHTIYRYNAIMMHLTSLFQLIFHFELRQASVISNQSDVEKRLSLAVSSELLSKCTVTRSVRILRVQPAHFAGTVQNFAILI